MSTPTKPTLRWQRPVDALGLVDLRQEPSPLVQCPTPTGFVFPFVPSPLRCASLGITVPDAEPRAKRDAEQAGLSRPALAKINVNVAEGKRAKGAGGTPKSSSRGEGGENWFSVFRQGGEGTHSLPAWPQENHRRF
jgi:hypothetical protein